MVNLVCASVNTQVVLCVFLMLERANVKGHGVYRSSGVCVCVIWLDDSANYC